MARLRQLVQKALRVRSVGCAYGIRLRPQWDDTTFQLYVRGAYGRFYADYLAVQKAPFAFVDIGANQGLYSILAAKNMNCIGVAAFEPVSQTCAILRENLALNKTEDVVVHQLAISDAPGDGVMHINPAHSGIASLRGDVAATENEERVAVIDQTGLGPLLDFGGRPVIVKIDVEGHEETVLRALLQTDCAPHIHSVFYECDVRWVDPEEIKKLLQASGFSEFQKIGEGSHYDVLASR